MNRNILEAEHVLDQIPSSSWAKTLASDSAICMVETIETLYFVYDQTFWRSVLGTLVGGCARIGSGQSALLGSIDLCIEPIHVYENHPYAYAYQR